MPLFAKVNSVGVITEFPIYEQQVRAAFPRTSFPAKMTGAPSGYAIVQDTPVPEYDSMTQEIVDGGAVKEGSVYKRVWNVVPLSAEKITENQLNAAKQVRAEQVSNIKVTTTAGNEFDGDEVAQGRMARAISSMEDNDVTNWVLANNTVVSVSCTELKEALRLAGAAQTAIWVAPYL